MQLLLRNILNPHANPFLLWRLPSSEIRCRVFVLEFYQPFVGPICLLLYDTIDRGGAFVKNVVKFKPDYTVSRLRTRQSPRSSPWETESCPSLSFCDRTAS